MGAINYIAGNTFRLMRRQWFLSTLTLLTAAAMFWLLGVISLTAINVQNVMNRIESELVVQVYFKKGIDVQLCVEKIKTLSWVTDVTVISPEDSLAKLESRLGQQSRATKLIGENPLPWSVSLGVTRAEDVDILAKNLIVMPEVDDVVYAGTFIKKLGKLSTLINRILLAILILTLFITSLVVFNTIRISLFSQREEISIMSLVGATRGYIAFPFILQGLILAGLGSVLSALGLAFLYDSGLKMLQESLPFVPLVVDSFVLIRFYVILVILGVALGWICSYISVSRYIAVATRPL